MILKRYNQNLWGALFVGAPGQLPTLPSPKSGPGHKDCTARYTYLSGLILERGVPRFPSVSPIHRCVTGYTRVDLHD